MFRHVRGAIIGAAISIIPLVEFCKFITNLNVKKSFKTIKDNKKVINKQKI